MPRSPLAPQSRASRAAWAALPAAALIGLSAPLATALPGGLDPAAVQAALSSPISVPAGQTTTVFLPVPADAAYSGGGWNISAGGGSATITAPAEGGQVSVPVSYNGYSGTITLVATAPENADIGGTAGEPGQSGEPRQSGESVQGDNSSGNGEGEGAGGAGASSSEGGAAADLPQVPGTVPARELADPADMTNAEMIYLDSTIEGNTITAKLSLEQALDFYNRFGNIDKETMTLRYLDGTGNIIKGVQRDVDAASRTLTLTYPEGEAPDNPFIMQLVRKDGTGVAFQVRLRDPNFAVADAPEEEQKAQEAADSPQVSAYGRGFLVGVVVTVVTLATIIGVLLRRRWKSRRQA